MKLRFNIKHIDTKAEPVYNCHDDVVQTDLTDVALKLSVGNVVLLDEVDLSSFTGPANADVTLADDTVVTAIVTRDGDYITIDTPIVDITNSALLKVEISKSGYLTYINDNIKLYGYDLGNDLVVTDNLDFYFVLVSNNIPDYPYADFITYWRPFTKKVEVIKNNSSVYTGINYTNSLTSLSFANGTICNDGGDITHTVSYPVPYRDSYRTATCQVVKSIDLFKWLPDYINITPCKTCNDLAESLPYITEIGFDFSVLGIVRIDDVISYPYKYQYVNYHIIRDNVVISQQERIFDIEYGVTPSNFTYEFPTSILPYGGDLLIQYSIGASNDTSRTKLWIKCTNVDIFRGNALIEINKTDCVTYNFKNYHLDTLPYTLKKYNLVTKVFDEVGVASLTANDTTQVTLNSDGIYDFIVEVNGEFQHYIMFAHCELEACINKYINKLMSCKSKCDPSFNCDHTLTYDYNSIMALKNVYLEYINSVYANEYFITTPEVNDDLDSIILDKIYTIQDIADKMYEYCTDCQSPCGCSDSSDSSTNCSEC